jgi:phytoene synthase
MKQLFDDLSMKCSKNVTSSYSTSFAWAVNMLAPRIRPAIHSIYGFVRLADEIVDSFHDWDKKELLDKFENDFYEALEKKISLNPILNSFQHTVHQYQIDLTLIQAFLRSMRMDLDKKEYTSIEEYEAYIYGSADVVGLMCLKVFVNGDHKKYDELKDSAQKLGSAFQKVNFLRDIKDDMEILNRSYFPHIDLSNLEKESKEMIVAEIENDFKDALKGIVHLPNTSKFGVYTAYIYYRQLLKKLKETPSSQIMEIRIRVADYFKMILLIKSYFSIKLKLI